MPIVPRFSLEQSDARVELSIEVPFSRKVSGMELVIVESCQVNFHCRPYLLRIVLPGPVVEAATTARLERDRVVVCMPKATPGQHFERLDLLSSLLQPSARRAASQQHPVEEKEDDETMEKLGYGFFGTTRGELARVLDEFPDLVDVPRPEATPKVARRALREFNEDTVFSLSRFRADAIQGAEDDLYLEAQRYRPWWEPTRPPLGFRPSAGPPENVLDALSNLRLSVASPQSSSPFVFGSAASGEAKSTQAEAVFSKEEQDQMLTLTVRTPPASFSPARGLLACLEVLLAYVHELRACAGDLSCESPYNIRLLSSTLSWLQEFSDTEDVLVAFARRALCYPYLRRWDLVLKAFRDAGVLLKGGVRMGVKALLKVHEAFRKSDTLYLHNRLYISDMCVFFQSVSEESLANVVEKVDAWVLRVGIATVIPPAEAVGGWKLSKRNRIGAGLASKGEKDELENDDDVFEGLD